MEDLKIRMEIEPMVLGLKKLTHLEIEVSHDSGGYSLNGEYRQRGIRCDVHPLEIQDFNGHKIIGRVFDGKTEHQGFYTHLVDCQKKSQKKMEKVFEQIKPHAEEIKTMFLDGKYYEIACLLKSVVK